MKRFLDKEAIEQFIKDNYAKKKKDFVKDWGISYSHFLRMVEGRGSCGSKSLKKLSDLATRFGEELEMLLQPVPIIFRDLEVLEVIVKDKEGHLIATISSDNEVCSEGYVVEYILKN